MPRDGKSASARAQSALERLPRGFGVKRGGGPGLARVEDLHDRPAIAAKKGHRGHAQSTFDDIFEQRLLLGPVHARAQGQQSLRTNVEIGQGFHERGFLSRIRAKSHIHETVVCPS